MAFPLCESISIDTLTRNHWVLKEENSLFWHTVVLNWINKFTGLPAYKDEKEKGYIVQN